MGFKSNSISDTQDRISCSRPSVSGSYRSKFGSYGRLPEGRIMMGRYSVMQGRAPIRADSYNCLRDSNRQSLGPMFDGRIGTSGLSRSRILMGSNMTMRKALDKTDMRQSCSSVNLRTNVPTKATIVDTMNKLESEERDRNGEDNKSKNKIQKFIKQFKKKLSKDKEKQNGKENKDPGIEIPKESKNISWTVIKIGKPISRSKSQKLNLIQEPRRKLNPSHQSTPRLRFM